MSYDTNLQHWLVDGRGEVCVIGLKEWEVCVESPLTLWCPQAATGGVEVRFEVNVLVENSAMLLLACARNWRGGELLHTARTGAYADYAFGDLTCYTIGFNRAGHVRNDRQPNATTVNVRRIGGPLGQVFAGIDLGDQSPAMLQRWRQWDAATLLGSAGEPSAGVGCYYSYRARFQPPAISFYLRDRLLLTVVDHQPSPLRGGYLAIRNMTPGARFRVRSLDIAGC